MTLTRSTVWEFSTIKYSNRESKATSIKMKITDPVESYTITVTFTSVNWRNFRDTVLANSYNPPKHLKEITAKIKRILLVTLSTKMAGFTKVFTKMT